MANGFLIPKQIAKELGVNVSKVLGWIRSGELVAINTSDSARPRYRISREAYAQFLESRSTAPAENPKRRHVTVAEEYV